MEQETPGDLTALLARIREGKAGADNRLFEVGFGEFRRIAANMMRRERPDHTLQPSALVNEAWIKLTQGKVLEKATDRRYLYGAIFQAMRQVLVDHARGRGARKRLGDHARIPLDNALAFFEERNLDIIALDDALTTLAGECERQSLVVTLRFFAGLSVREVAEILEISVATVEADWRFARAWLRLRMGGEGDAARSAQESV